MPETPINQDDPPQEPPTLPFLQRLLPGGVITTKQKRLGIGLLLGVALVILSFSSNSGPAPTSNVQTTKPSIINQPDASVMPQKITEIRKILDQQNADILQKQKEVKQAQELALTQLNQPNGAVSQPNGGAVSPYPNAPTYPQPPANGSYNQPVANVVKHHGPSSLIVEDLRHLKDAPSPLSGTDLYRPASVSLPAPANAQPSAAESLAEETHKRDILAFDASLPTMILPEGTVIESVLTNEIEGAYQGPVNCLVTTNVYAPGTRTLLIPQGSRLLGEALAVNSLNQKRLAVTFHSVLIQNGASFYTVSLDKQPALDQAGGAGLQDKVNTHLASTLGISLAVGGIAGLSQIGNSSSGFGLDPSASFRNGVTQNVSQSSVQILDRLLNRPPTLLIRPGTRAKILLIGNVIVPVFPGRSR